MVLNISLCNTITVLIQGITMALDGEPQIPRSEIEHMESLILPRFTSYDGLLINVPVDFQQGPVVDGEEPPFGLGRIAVVANEYFELKIGILDVHRIYKDGHRLSINDLRELLLLVKQKASPGFIVGLNPTNVNVEAGIEISKLLDKLGIPYLLGGYFATLSDANEVFRYFPKALGFIPRNGEVAYSSVVACRVIPNFADLQKSIAGFYTQDSVHKPVFPVRAFGRKITPIHAPPIDQKEYFYKPFTTLVLDEATCEELGIEYKSYTEASTYLTDGCPFECGFCSSPYMKQRHYERPTILQIADEVERLVGQGADAIHFLDDLIFIKESDIHSFHTEMQKRNLLGKFIWRGMGRANLIDRWSDETMQKLKETGCWQLAIGVESGSPTILEFIKKKVDPEMVLRTTEKNARFKIGTKGFFIYGFPTETEADMQMTYKLALDMAKRGSTSIAAFEFHPYPGTALYEWIKQNSPNVLAQLTYLTTSQTEIDQDDTIGVESKRKIQKAGMWLPDDLTISALPSKQVRVYVKRTIDDFYKIRDGRRSKK